MNPSRSVILIHLIPSRQRASPLDYIAHSPGHPRLIQRFIHVVVRTDQIELPVLDALHAILGTLLGEPRTSWLLVDDFVGGLGSGVAGEARVCPAWNQEVDGGQW